MNQSDVLQHLAALVACDTQNPPRNIDGGSPVMQYCRDAVGAEFDVRVDDLGDGHVSFFAVRGRPGVIFNVHLDTVPCGSGWDSDPLALEVDGQRAIGRGVCDIKGAAACLLAIAEQAPPNMAMLFTTDEEGTQGRCVRAFCESRECERFSQAVVAEPTACKAVLGHRGFLAVEGRFRGAPGHSSEARALKDNAVHQMVHWASAALALARKRITSDNEPGTCLNIGCVEGGTANNVIAGESVVQWSARLRPGASNSEFLEEIQACAPEGASVDWRIEHDGEPLPAAGQSDQQAREFADRHGLPVAHDVDFWTEASIFSEFGMPALVLGPGHIEQAHIPNEWVELAQLDRARGMYSRVIESDG